MDGSLAPVRNTVTHWLEVLVCVKLTILVAAGLNDDSGGFTVLVD